MRRATLFVLLAMAVACGPSRGNRDQRAPISVFAAASLKTALDDVESRVVRPAGYTLRLTYAGTPALARQIEAGAPADIFIAADDWWMDYLQRAHHVRSASRVVLFGNRLVVVAPSSASVRLELDSADSWLAALDGGRLAMGQPDSVPAGRYAREALTSLGVWSAVADRLAPHDNVRAALALVVRGEAPLGIVYASDAVGEPRVRVVRPLADDSHSPIRYPAALTSAAGPGAAAVLRVLTSGEARMVFGRHGFQVLAP